MTRARAISLLGGSTLLNLPKLDVPLDEIGDYVHVVSDGLVGHVYRATKEEAKEFEKNIFSDIKYEITNIHGFDEESDNKYWDLEFTVKTNNQSVYPSLCMDFMKHIEDKLGGESELEVSPARNSYRIEHPKAEFEAYCAFFNPEHKEEGICFSTGRSASELADKKTTINWFQEFIDRLK